jgi:WD40 repeat protein
LIFFQVNSVLKLGIFSPFLVLSLANINISSFAQIEANHPSIHRLSVTSNCVAETVHDGSIEAIASGGNILASSGDRDKIMRVWDLQTQQQIFASEAQSDWIQRIVVTQDGKTVISQYYGNRLEIWDVETQRLLFTIDPIEGMWGVTALAVSPDGTKLAIANLQTIRIWDLEAQRQIREIDQGTRLGIGDGFFTSDPVTFLSFSQDSQKLYSGGSLLDQIILKVWQLKTGEEIAQFQEHTPDTSRVSNVYVTPDETYMVVEDFGNFVSLKNLQTNDRIEIAIKNAPSYHYYFATFLDFHTDVENQSLIGVSRQGIFVWDTVTGELKKSQIFPDLTIRSSTLSSDGKTMILGDNNGSIHRLYLNSELGLEDFKVCHSTPEVLNPN